MLSLLVPFPELSGVTFMPCLKAKTMNPSKNTPQRIAMSGCISRLSSTRFREQGQLPRLRFDLGLVGEVGRIDTRKTMIREFWIGGVAAGLAHRTVHAVDRQEGERIGADDFAHLLEVVGRGQQTAAIRQVDAVIIGVNDRRRSEA